MAEFLCKNCGATLQYGSVKKEIVCPRCGTKYLLSSRKKARTIYISQNTVREPLLRRAFLFLEDGDWEQANLYCDRVLDENPENAGAYLGKLMASRSVKSPNELVHCKEPLEEDNNYQKILRFGDASLCDALKAYNKKIRKQNVAKKEKRKRLIWSVFTSVLSILIIGILIIGVLPSKPTDEEVGFTDILLKSSDIVAIAAGDEHLVGLKEDGTVVARGNNEYGQCAVGNWSDIVAISARGNQTVGLKKDGTVVATDDNYDRCDVEDWTDIVAISAGWYHTVGLKNDGTVVTTGHNNFGRCNVEDWTDIVSVSAGLDYTCGLKKNGTVAVTEDKDSSEWDLDDWDLGDWTDIVAISNGWQFALGLKKDGTVIAMGSDSCCDVEDWTDIAEVFAGRKQSYGLKKDGTVVAIGNNEYSQCDVEGWTDIVEISVGKYQTFGLKKDGTVVATHYSYDDQNEVEERKGLRGWLINLF